MAAINSSRCETCDVTLVVERKKDGENKVGVAMLYRDMNKPDACQPISPQFLFL
jgi:hypothetical protein